MARSRGIVDDFRCAFYREVLGREPRLDVPGMTEFELAEGTVLGLMPESGIERLLGVVTGPRVARCELYLVLEDLEPALARALGAGAELLSGAADRDWGARVAYVRDLDGHVLALASV
ncbi:MAG: glyoxalase [Candidatus Eremiobacteraeota bacterium]|nr:glyoxalase [Candidatus Eremiobacteraeota bacterium]